MNQDRWFWPLLAVLLALPFLCGLEPARIEAGAVECGECGAHVTAVYMVPDCDGELIEVCAECYRPELDGIREPVRRIPTNAEKCAHCGHVTFETWTLDDGKGPRELARVCRNCYRKGM